MDRSRFEAAQKKYYTSEINRAVPTHHNLPTNPEMDAALGNIYPNVPETTSFDPTQFASMFSKNSNVVDADRRCRQLPTPTPSMRNPASRTGCGWWHIPNMNLQSVGALGTRRGPMSPTLDRDYGSGQWIWDPAKAAELEGIKQASRITSCAGIEGNENIGWCPTTNRAVVTDGQGNPAFPKNPKGDCPGGGIIMSKDECDPNWKCKGLGYPSEDGAIRLYTQADCTTLGGNWYGNGECLHPKGGSWSAVCKGLNGTISSGSPGVPGSANPVDRCAQINGAISHRCIQDIVKQKCNTNGTLYQALESGYAGSSDKFNDMDAVLQERGFSIQRGIVNDGRLTVSNATAAVTQIKSWTTDSNARTAAAASNLCYGSPFDACAFDSTTAKPFSSRCITRVALAAGWARTGTAMPDNAGLTEWNKLNTWNDVLSRITSWKNLADTPSSSQLEYIKRVYGIQARYPDHCAPEDLGCWRDNWDRALNSQSVRGHNKDTCAALAKQRNHRYFSVQDGNECYTGEHGYNKYGKIADAGPNCPPGGGPWSAHTWRIPGLSLQNPNLVLNTARGAPPWDQETVKKSLIPNTISYGKELLVGESDPISIIPTNAGTYINNGTYFLGSVVSHKGQMYLNLSWNKDKRGPAYRGTFTQDPDVDTFAWVPVRVV
jgi:hypothetical protein